MPGPNLEAIPLPEEGQKKEKMSAKEMLERALKECKISSLKETKSSTRLINTSEQSGPKSVMKNFQSSQSIVDELFKDYMSMKLAPPKKNDTIESHQSKSTDLKGSTSVEEMSKILDMEIKSIRSNSDDSTPLGFSKKKDKHDKAHRKHKKSKKSKSSSSKSENELKHNSSDVVRPSKGDTFSTPIHPPKSKSPFRDKTASQDVPNSSNLNETAVPQLPTISDEIPATSQQPVQQSTKDPEPSPSLKESIFSEEKLNESQSVSETVGPESEKSAPASSVHPGVVSMLPAPVTRKLGPLQLGLKLSDQSVSLIQSKEKIGSDGRVWEEGELVSSHSETSNKDSDSDNDGFPSETGSIDSGAEDWRNQTSSKHKKKHKHKHKKKKKKSSKERDRDSSSKPKDQSDSEKTEEKEKSNKNKTDESRSDGSKTKSSDGCKVDEAQKSSKSESRKAEESKKYKSDRSKSSSSKSAEESKKSKSDSSKRDNDSDRSRDERKRKRSRSRSKSPKRRKKSRTRSRSKSPKSSRKGSHYTEWDARRYLEDSHKSSRGRSRSRSRSPRGRRKRSPGERRQTGSRDRRQEKEDKDLRLQIDKTKLRKIAIANALQNMKSGQGPQVTDVVTIKSGGKSVEELTDFCKKISERDKDRDESDNNVSDSEEEQGGPASEDDETLIHHPFKVKDSSSNIVMNIRNAKQLPVLTPSEKQAQQASLRLTFPVSSGSHHRASESEWVPVERTTAPKTVTQSTPPVTVKAPAPMPPPPPPDPPKKDDNVFANQEEGQRLDIGSIISERLQAVRKLQENPFDMQALSKMHQVQEKASQWASSRHLPGQFTGSTGATVLSQHQLIGDRKNQAWAKKVALWLLTQLRPAET